LKQIRFHEFGGPEVLTLDDVDDPKPVTGQALVRVWAAGVNPTDITTRTGRSPAQGAFPGTLGRDASGVIEAVGGSVKSVSVGEKVIVRGATAGYAELLVAPEGDLYPVPAGLGPVEAASVGVTYSTAWDAVVNKAQVQRGQTVLVQGAAGGVGIAAVQIAKSLGAIVVGAASTDEKLAWVKEHGADHCVNYSEDGWADRVKELTRGVDAVIDGVGGDYFVPAFGCLKPGGSIAVYGAAAGREVNFNLASLFRIRARVLGSGGVGSSREDLERVLGMFAAGTLKPTVERTWPLAEAAEAHRHVEGRKVLGKVVLVVGK
jgi:NADPH2:quinone reductase